jgi:hypothetical protein
VEVVLVTVSQALLVTGTLLQLVFMEMLQSLLHLFTQPASSFLTDGIWMVGSWIVGMEMEGICLSGMEMLLAAAAEDAAAGAAAAPLAATLLEMSTDTAEQSHKAKSQQLP